MVLRTTSDALRVACFVGLLAAPIGLAIAAGRGGFLWLAAGALAWALSVLIKGQLTLLVRFAGAKDLAPAYQAAVEGLLSAFFELGAALLAFASVLPPGTAWHAAAFGAGAGGAEVVWLFCIAIGAFSADHPENTPAGAQPKLPPHVEWTFVVERSTAFLGHVGSRGLVWLAVAGAHWCAILAVATFAAVDGVATYGVLRRWDWLELSRWRKFYGFTAAVGAFEFAAFVCVAAITE